MLKRKEMKKIIYILGLILILISSCQPQTEAELLDDIPNEQISINDSTQISINNQLLTGGWPSTMPTTTQLTITYEYYDDLDGPYASGYFDHILVQFNKTFNLDIPLTITVPNNTDILITVVVGTTGLGGSFNTVYPNQGITYITTITPKDIQPTYLLGPSQFGGISTTFNF